MASSLPIGEFSLSKDAVLHCRYNTQICQVKKALHRTLVRKTEKI